MINILDLFSGAGGFSLALDQAGIKANHYFSEIDSHAIAVYKQQFKNAKYTGSVKDVRGADLPKINIITFGSPCQDFSLAGKRSGMGGERSSLISEAIRLINECGPDFFIWENVKGVYSSNEGRDFQAILREFANIGGYRLEWQLLNTKWFLPQNRERVYLVGHLAKSGRDFKQIFPVGENDNLVRKTRKEARNREEIANTISSAEYKLNLATNYVKVKSATNQGFELANEGDSINLSQPASKTRRGRVGKGVAQTLETSCNQAVIVAMRGRGKDNNIRRLTPIECERLQGFPDNWTSMGIYNDQEKAVSDTQRYKLMGNAISVPVARAIFLKLKNQL